MDSENGLFSDALFSLPDEYSITQRSRSASGQFLASDNPKEKYFSFSATTKKLEISGPLAHRMRPKILADFVGQEHIQSPTSPLSMIIQGNSDTSLILYGPPGTGKTTIAYIIAQETQRHCETLSALDLTVKELRGYIDAARIRRANGIRTILFIDEIHRFSKSQQDSLLAAVEHGIILLIAATTENPSFSVISPLLSRSLIVPLYALTDHDITKILLTAIAADNGLNNTVSLEQESIAAICRLSSGDARRALTILESAAAAALIRAEKKSPGLVNGELTTKIPSEADIESPPEITVADISQSLTAAIVRYDKDGDQHYDVISAFIKSVRGSDVDAAIHYLARMIAAGEDPLFIARRLLILASEDIGIADPQALLIATAAAQTVQMIGMPEGRLPLANATIYLATAPKSNAVITAIDSAIADVAAGKGGSIPPHLRDAHYCGAKKIGHGIDYKYPHRFDNGVIDQQYPPDDLVGKNYYFPSRYGHENAIAARVEKLRKNIRKT